MPNRRSVVKLMLALPAAALPAWSKQLLAEAEPPLAHGDGSGSSTMSIPDNFLGLGYEMSSVATAGLLSPKNKVYVQLLRNLGPRGVLRIGGIVADFTRYESSAPAVSEPTNTAINQESIQQLRGFLDAVDWSAIWSVNFGSGTLNDAIIEARAVSAILGPRLTALELGNEVENYGHGKRPLRTPPYTYETYHDEYSQWHAALSAAVPGLHFAAPDTADSVEWVERMASDAHGDVQLLTTHYYRGDQKQGTQAQLLRPDPDLLHKLERLRAASMRAGLPWRMCETNSFFGGGRQGVSDTLAGALWTLEFMLLLASSGCAGVNLETGVNQLGFISFYSPIQDDRAGHNRAGAPYYGLLAFAAALSRGRDISVYVPAASDKDTSSVHTLSHRGAVQAIVLLNRSLEDTLRQPLHEYGLHDPMALRLTGPAADSGDGVTLGGAEVDQDGLWKPRYERQAGLVAEVLPASALIVYASKRSSA